MQKGFSSVRNDVETFKSNGYTVTPEKDCEYLQDSGATGEDVLGVRLDTPLALGQI